jgi:magnesium transporter
MAEIVAPSEWRELLAQQRWEELQQKLEDAHYSDIAEILTVLPPKERAIVFRLVGKERASDVFGYLAPGEQRELIHSLSAGETKQMLDSMRPDDRTHFLARCPPKLRANCSKNFPRKN